MRLSYSSILVLLITVAFANADTINVPADQPTIQAGIDAAMNGDIVLVAVGMYIENINFHGKAITVKSDKGAATTVIDGSSPSGPTRGSCVTFRNGEGQDSVLEGFTLTNGTGTKYVCPLVALYCGGGIFCTATSPTITDCMISGNSAENGGGIYNWESTLTVTNCIFYQNSADCGGGMYNHQYSSPTVTNSTFLENSAEYGGGGISNWSPDFATVTSCFFALNSAESGGGMRNYYCSPEVSNCVFSQNSAANGGGMFNVNNASPNVTSCTFFGNSAMQAWGGGVYNDEGSSPDLIHCLFIENTAHVGGGGIYNVLYSSPRLANCLFSRNSVSVFGGGIGTYYQSSFKATNCTFFGNSADMGGGIYCGYSQPTIANTVLWGNSALNGPEIMLESETSPSVLDISFSDVEGGKSSVGMDSGCTLNWGAGMIDADPLFVDAANNDFHLTFPSPCKDTGDNSVVTELYDFEGDPRIAYGTVDMGADEFYTHLYVTGDKMPGGSIHGKFVGLPGTTPVGLFIGSGVLSSPIHTMWGEYWLQSPYVLLGPLGSIPSNGVMVLPATLPLGMTEPVDIPMQALIGLNADSLTNLCVLEVR